MFIAFLSLMLITTSITMHAMEKEIEKKKVTWNEEVQIAPQKKPCRSQCSLIKATHKNQFDIVEKILCAPLCNVNQQDEWKRTALHYAALHERLEILKVLLNDPRIDASIKDSDDKLPYKLINTANAEMKKLRKKLSARAQLDSIINTEKRKLDAPITDTQINILFSLIKIKSVNISVDVDDEFIKKMITLRDIQ